MALQLTERGAGRFLSALQDEIRQAQLLDANGEQIQGWNYSPRDVDPELWEGTTYTPGFNWIFVSTDAEATPPVIIAGLGWADAAGQVLAMEPLVEPFVVQRTGQTITVDPVLKIFGVVGVATES